MNSVMVLKQDSNHFASLDYEGFDTLHPKPISMSFFTIILECGNWGLREGKYGKDSNSSAISFTKFEGFTNCH